MALFVILNFEDDDQGEAQNSTTRAVVRQPNKATVATVPKHVRGSAMSTVQGIASKARKKESFIKSNQVFHYSGIELIRKDALKSLSRTDVDAVRSDIAKAKKVYIIMHGSPDVTDHGFTNSQAKITWQQLSNLALLLFPKRSARYYISLIMCYGARTNNFKANHLGQMSASDIKTSFAYKFFRALCVHRNIELTACTGAVSTDAMSGENNVESEEWVCAVLDITDYKKDKPSRDTLQQNLDLTKTRYLLAEGGNLEGWKSLYTAFGLDKNKKGFTQTERDIENFHRRTTHTYAGLKAQKDRATTVHGGKSNLNKYGRIRYVYDGAGALTIINKYGDPTDPAIGEDFVMYRGPLL